MGGSYQAINDCPSQNCPLWTDRSGKKRKGQRPLSAIKGFCLECVGGLEEVKKCIGKMLFGPDCLLHPYRLGRNPRKRGQGQVQNLFRSPNGEGVDAPESHEDGQQMVG
ncbi:hypothetical protein FAK_30940 [Desulfoferula mesophila]|uniref:Uncharacterized protein n=1 Tax=Desulfoferula mesophila TaxID=3058419 RepID=A0AAU9EG01_9BACT|nr:hypothetical protein FAK_30940 [Desulfoferula mesophilus]